jgi:hypothetical protein
LANRNIGITAIWYILCPFDGHVTIWYIFPRFGILRQEKSGNPVRESLSPSLCNRFANFSLQVILMNSLGWSSPEQTSQIVLAVGKTTAEFFFSETKCRNS